MLAFVECAQSGALHGGDVNEHILATALRLDKAVTLGRVEPLHCPARHVALPRNDEHSRAAIAALGKQKAAGVTGAARVPIRPDQHDTRATHVVATSEKKQEKRHG